VPPNASAEAGDDLIADLRVIAASAILSMAAIAGSVLCERRV
jgi:hypothetical protein